MKQERKEDYYWIYNDCIRTLWLTPSDFKYRKESGWKVFVTYELALKHSNKR